jgi:hypothetical protein
MLSRLVRIVDRKTDRFRGLPMLSPALRKRQRQITYWTTILYDAMAPRRSRSVYVLGHPKSGTNWMCSLLSSYLDIPILMAWVEWHPTTKPRVFHMHRVLPFRSTDRRTVYMHRDGRDIVVSHYFAMLRAPSTDELNAEAMRAPVSRLLGNPMSEERIREHLPKYIRYLQDSRSSSVNYQEHHAACKNRGFVRVSFESLVDDTVGALTRTLQELTGREAESSRVAQAVEEHAFERKKKKAKFSHFYRKGKAGDWRNYFTREAGRVFVECAGDALIELGYEPDHSWVDRLGD